MHVEHVGKADLLNHEQIAGETSSVRNPHLSRMFCVSMGSMYRTRDPDGRPDPDKWELKGQAQARHADGRLTCFIWHLQGHKGISRWAT